MPASASPSEPPAPRRRGTRRLVAAAATLLLILVLLIVVPLLALRSLGVRQAILTRAGDALRSSTGLEVGARDFRLGLRRRRIEIDQLTIGAAAGDRPFLVVERIAAVVDARTLLRRPLRILDLEVGAARLDLSAPLPAPDPAAEPEQPAAPLPIEILRLTLEGGTVVGSTRSAGATEWIGSWNVDQLAATGSLTPEGLALAVEGGLLRISGQPPARGVEANLSGRVTGPAAGPFTIDELRVAGDGLDLTARGVFGLAEADPQRVALTLDAEPGRLFPEADRSRLTATADLDLRAFTGTLDAEASGAPSELLEPVLGAELFARLGAAGTLVDGDVDLRLAGRDRVSGSARLHWREGADGDGATLLMVEAATVDDDATDGDSEVGRATARAQAPENRAAGGASSSTAPTPPAFAAGQAGVVVLDVEAHLLPQWSGQRVASARLRLPAWNRAAEAELVVSRATVETADIARTLADVAARFPALLPALPAGVPLAGPLVIHAAASGPVGDPQLDFDADWRPQPGARVILRGGGHPIGSSDRARRLAARATVSALDLGAIAALAETVPGGRVDGVIDLDLDGERLRAGAVLDGRELVLAPDHRVDALHVELSGTPREIELERLEAAAGDARLVASGRFELDPGADLPLRAATLDATLERPVEGVTRVEARVALAGGILRLEVPAAATDYGDASGRVGLPLGALARIPALAATIAALPTPVTDGPISIAATAPALDGAALLRRLGIAGPSTLTGDVALAMSFDPGRPAAGDGMITVRRLIAADDGSPASTPGPPPRSRSEQRVATATAAPGAALERDRPGARLEALDPVTLRLAGGRLELDPLRIAVGGADALQGQGQGQGVELRLAATVELSTDWQPNDPLSDLAGPLRLDAAAESLDGAALYAALGQVPPFESLRADGVELRLTLDPADPGAAAGTVAVRALDVGLPDDHRLRLGEPLAIALADRQLRVAPTRFEIDGQVLTVSGEARFAPDWNPDRPPAELIAALDASIVGVLEAEALNPYLAGAVASGAFDLDVVVSGTIESLGGHASLGPAAPGAEIVLYGPYYTRLRDPRVGLRLEGGAVVIESATAELNEGSLRVTGGADLGDGTIDVTAALDSVRYRLDYGLMTQAGGELRLTRAEGGPMRLEGRVLLARGVLRRDLDTDREVLRYLFAPEPVIAPGALDDLELDLELATTDGVRIRNNLADLRATWAPLTITGTLAAPLIEGSIDLDPGGYLFAYGQTVRVDSGSLELRGDGSPPELEIETTTSIEDPSVARAAHRRGFVDMLRDPAGTADDESPDLEAAISAGLAGYYGERLAGRLSEGLGALDVSLRPILVFGLDNPGTELTVSRGLNAYVTAAVSVSLREEGRQTYVAELHDIGSLPAFLGQLYTLHERADRSDVDESGSSEGVVVQQRLLFGGGAARQEAPSGPRLRRLVLDAPEHVLGRRAVRKALDYERGQPLTEDAAFETEVEVAELLRRRGYPGSRVEAELVPAGPERTDLRIAVDPGPRVDFEFRGVALHRRQQRMIASIYRPDFYQPISLDEMREQTVRELRAAGYLDPFVEITIVGATAPIESATTSIGSTSPPGGPGRSPADPAQADRRVIVEARGGERVTLVEPRFDGIDADAAAAVATRFPTPVLRAELAVGEGGADRRLRTALSEEGYPGAVVASRRLEPSGPDVVSDAVEPPTPSSGAAGKGRPARRPVLTIEPAGPRHRIAEVRVTGIEDDGTLALAALAPVSPGDAVRSETITRGAIAIEDALHQRGHARARVRARLPPAEASRPDRTLTYEVDRSGVYRIEEVTLTGVGATRGAWAQAVADIAPGAPLDTAAVRAARRRLFETGLFESVLPEIDYGSPGTADLTFVLEERPRFEVAYGLLWQSDRGASAVIDAVDKNLLGRGLTLGARALYRDDDRSGRVYAALPRLFGTQGSLQLFTEYSEHDDQDGFFLVDNETFEINLAAALPLKPRLTGRLYGRYLDVTDTFVDSDPLFPLPPFDVTFAWPSLGFQAFFEGRDDPVTTSRGTFASVDLSGADETIGSEFSYARFFGRASHHRALHLFGRRLVWAQSGRVGLARAFGGQELVSFELLFAGGQYSIRGYDEDSIGREALGAVSEQALLVLNEELHLPLWGDLLTGVVFVDAGNVWPDWRSLGDDYLTAAGLGFRVSTPVGLVRLDVAYPFDPPFDDDDEVKFYLGLGNVF